MSLAYGRQELVPKFHWSGGAGASPALRQAAPITWFDGLLIVVFMIGMYTNYTIFITPRVPFPLVPSGVAGLLLLWRRRDSITQAGLVGMVGLVLLYLVSILCATDLSFLGRRTNGLLQITYSIAIGYGLFLTVSQGSRRQVAGIFLGFALVIAAGCLLETYGGFRPVSDAVRRVIYSRGVYENDLRDVLLYKQIRPKFFASEPSSVTFCYAIFSFVWFVTSRMRGKLLAYLALITVGMFAMPGPTLLLMLLLALPYMLFLASRHDGHLDYVRLVRLMCVAALLCAVAWIAGETLFAARLQEIGRGNDPSFFYRVLGPALAGVHILARYPIAGAGLTGEPFIEGTVTNIYVQSPAYSVGWEVVSPATELLINFFWLHWIYLGIVWGIVITAAWSLWLRRLGVPSVAFCWFVWILMGQAAGAYVGPTCWAVLFLSGAAALLHEKEPVGQQPRVRRELLFGLPALLARRRRQAHDRSPSREELERSGVAIFGRRPGR
jgi:hypothetical protein